MSKRLLSRLATVVVSTALALTAMTTGGSAQKADITFFDVCSGANFQQFFNKILPLAQAELGFKISYAPGTGSGTPKRDCLLAKPTST